MIAGRLLTPAEYERMSWSVRNRAAEIMRSAESEIETEAREMAKDMKARVAAELRQIAETKARLKINRARNRYKEPARPMALVLAEAQAVLDSIPREAPEAYEERMAALREASRMRRVA